MGPRLQFTLGRLMGSVAMLAVSLGFVRCHLHLTDMLTQPSRYVFWVDTEYYRFAAIGAMVAAFAALFRARWNLFGDEPLPEGTSHTQPR